MTPTARSLTYLRQLGWMPAIVERWVPGSGTVPGATGIKIDLYGFGDVLAAHPGERRFLIVQATSLDHAGDRLAKARGRRELRTWLQTGGEFEVHGWAQIRGRWQVKRIGVKAEDLEPVILQAPKRRLRADQQPELFG